MCRTRLWVFLRADTGDVGAKLDSIRTDSLGTYQFGRVAPGDYFLEFEQLVAITTGPLGGPDQSPSSPRALRRSTCCIPVDLRDDRQARATPVDSTVAVIGDITAPPGVFTSGPEV